MAKSETPGAMPKRFLAQHKTEIVLPLLRGENIELVSHEVGRTAAEAFSLERSLSCRWLGRTQETSREG